MTTIANLLSDQTGAMAIETAIVAPVLLLLSFGGFQTGQMVARQNELQSAAAEAAQIALASKPDTTAKLDTIESIISASSGVPVSGITVTFRYRCGTTTTTVATAGTCGSSAEWTFVRIVINQTYTPIWTEFGIGSPVALQVDRTVQIS